MSLRAMDVGKPLDDPPERGLAANAEAQHISRQLWDDLYNAAAEHGAPVRIHHVSIPFARKVFDWVADHLSDEVAK